MTVRGGEEERRRGGEEERRRGGEEERRGGEEEEEEEEERLAAIHTGFKGYRKCVVAIYTVFKWYLLKPMHFQGGCRSDVKTHAQSNKKRENPFTEVPKTV